MAMRTFRSVCARSSTWITGSTTGPDHIATGRGKLVLSREGNVLANAVRSSLLHIEGALDSICSSDVSGRLVIGSLPSFGAKWLAPRLKQFVDLHPKVEINLLSYVSLDNVIANGALFYHEAAENRPAIKALSNWMHAQIKSESL